MAKSLSTPHLAECELAFRINLVKKRLRSYPLDRMNFIIQDLERPKNEHRQAELPLRHEPIPDRTHFEEGPHSITGHGELSVYADVTAEDGRLHTLRFWPLSYAISTLFFYATPVVFRRG